MSVCESVGVRGVGGKDEVEGTGEGDGSYLVDRGV